MSWFLHIYIGSKQKCRLVVDIMGFTQLPVWTNGSVFPSKGFGMGGCSNHVKFSLVKPCQSSQLEENLVSGRPPSSVFVAVPEFGGSDHFKFV